MIMIKIYIKPNNNNSNYNIVSNRRRQETDGQTGTQTNFGSDRSLKQEE